MASLKHNAKARQAYQELLLTKLTNSEKLQATLGIAQSWEAEGNGNKAIAVAWSGIPASFNGCKKEEIILIKQLLRLIINNAEQTSNEIDQEDALAILQSIQPIK